MSKKIIPFVKNNGNFKCADPEGVLEVAKVLESALDVNPPFILEIKWGKDECTHVATRKEFLEHYLNWAVETIYELVYTE